MVLTVMLTAAIGGVLAVVLYAERRERRTARNAKCLRPQR